METNFWLGAIITILQGGVVLHYLPKILDAFDVNISIAAAPPAYDLQFAVHAAAAAVILAFPGVLAYAADAASVPLESLVDVWKRKLTPRPAENGAIVMLYEAMLKQNIDVTEIIKEWDLDGDGSVSDWEMKEAFQLLNIPEYAHGLLQNILMEGTDGDPQVSSLMDTIQKLYFDIKEAKEASPTYRDIATENELKTKLTFVEIFNQLDKDGSGFICKAEFATMSDRGYYKKTLTKQESDDLFDSADVLGLGRLNLLEFMTIMRKIVKVGIQEIGYGYLPLAWGSLTSYWIGLGIKE